MCSPCEFSGALRAILSTLNSNVTKRTLMDLYPSPSDPDRYSRMPHLSPGQSNYTAFNIFFGIGNIFAWFCSFRYCYVTRKEHNVSADGFRKHNPSINGVLIQGHYGIWLEAFALLRPLWISSPRLSRDGEGGADPISACVRGCS